MSSKLSRTTLYALRAAVWLGSRPPGDRASADVIAAATHVPPAFLKKVLRQLVEAGILTSERGHHGGFALARPCAEVSFLDVLEAMKMVVVDDACAFGWGQCDGNHPCPLHTSFLDLEIAMVGWAARHRLSDVVGPPTGGPPETGDEPTD